MPRGLPPDARVEPTREVLRRLWLGTGSVSFRTDEMKLLARARALSEQGWLVNAGVYPCHGTTYTQFKGAERLDFKALRDL